jgi:Icc-related predicted phosphoesterase
MRIVHFSDWHWEFAGLPNADLYICTGDMLADRGCEDKFGNRNKRLERIKQYAGMQLLQKNGGFKQYLGTPDAPLLCVRGNHDFVELAPLFADCNLVHEFVNNEVIELLGMKITGHRGVPPINGFYNDEFSQSDLMDRVRAMIVADLYITHYPPDCNQVGGDYGLQGMLNNLVYRDHNGRFPLHCFGHIHEACGVAKRDCVTFSNAATTFNVLEGSPEIGWTDVSPA